VSIAEVAARLRALLDEIARQRAVTAAIIESVTLARGRFRAVTRGAGHALVGEALATYAAAIDRLRNADRLLVASATAIVEYGRVIGINTMVAGQVALAIPSNAVADFLLGKSANDGWLGVTLYPVQVPELSIRAATSFGLVVLEVEPGSPAARASLLPGDILLGTEGKPFGLLEDLSRALRGKGPRLLRLEFLRGDYARIRKVTIQLGDQVTKRSAAA